MLVGKGAEYVYLSGHDRTIRRFAGGGERVSNTLAGGAMMIDRHHLDDLLGWQSIPRGVDLALINDVRIAGGKIYRTHGSGYMLVRNAKGHTWQVDDSYFIDLADITKPGCDLAFAGIA